MQKQKDEPNMTSLAMCGDYHAWVILAQERANGTVAMSHIRAYIWSIMAPIGIYALLQLYLCIYMYLDVMHCLFVFLNLIR